MGHLSDKKMEGRGGFNTVECLRGRLLAERQASKLANEDVKSVGIKLVELEKKLREEIRLREKAERRLKFLKKKLESFNISSSTSEESEQSYSSEKSKNSFTSSSSVSEENETMLHATKSPISEKSIHKVPPSSELSQTYNGPSVSKDYVYPQDLCENPRPNSQGFKNHENRVSISTSLKSSTEDSIAQSTDNYSSNTSTSDSSLEEPSQNPNPSSNNEKNDETREKILGSMGKTRQMIKANPTQALMQRQ